MFITLKVRKVVGGQGKYYVLFSLIFNFKKIFNKYIKWYKFKYKYTYYLKDETLHIHQILKTRINIIFFIRR